MASIHSLSDDTLRLIMEQLRDDFGPQISLKRARLVCKKFSELCQDVLWYDTPFSLFLATSDAHVDICFSHREVMALLSYIRDIKEQFPSVPSYHDDEIGHVFKVVLGALLRFMKRGKEERPPGVVICDVRGDAHPAIISELKNDRTRNIVDLDDLESQLPYELRSSDISKVGSVGLDLHAVSTISPRALEWLHQCCRLKCLTIDPDRLRAEQSKRLWNSFSSQTSIESLCLMSDIGSGGPMFSKFPWEKLKKLRLEYASFADGIVLPYQDRLVSLQDWEIHFGTDGFDTIGSSDFYSQIDDSEPLLIPSPNLEKLVLENVLPGFIRHFVEKMALVGLKSLQFSFPESDTYFDDWCYVDFYAELTQEIKKGCPRLERLGIDAPASFLSLRLKPGEHYELSSMVRNPCEPSQRKFLEALTAMPSLRHLRLEYGYPWPPHDFFVFDDSNLIATFSQLGSMKQGRPLESFVAVDKWRRGGNEDNQVRAIFAQDSARASLHKYRCHPLCCESCKSAAKRIISIWDSKNIVMVEEWEEKNTKVTDFCKYGSQSEW